MALLCRSSWEGKYPANQHLQRLPPEFNNPLEVFPICSISDFVTVEGFLAMVEVTKEIRKRV